MEYNEMLNKAVLQAKNGDIEGFENFYIITYQDLYKTILKMGNTEKQAEELMETVYVSAYGKMAQAPKDHLEEWLREILYELGEEELEENDFSDSEIIAALSEEKAATIFLKIEERLGILPKEEPEESVDWEGEEPENEKRSFFKIIISIVLAVFVVIIVWIFLWKKEGDVFSGKDLQKVVDIEETEYAAEEPETETEGEESITVHLADQIFILDLNGKLISSKREKEEYHPSQQKYKGYTYYLCNEQGLEGSLLRVYDNDPEKYELIDENVKDYVVTDDLIYYVKDGMIQQKSTDTIFGKRNFTYHLAMRDDGFYMVNEIGEIPGESTSSLEQEGLVYYLDKGYVQSVEEADCWYNGVKYTLEDKDGDGMKELCWQSQSDEGIFLKEGFWIDSFCLVGDWIYYSAFEQTDPNNMYYSRIYRIRPDDSLQELVTDTFQGNITHMYYSEEKGKIYGEFMPDAYHRYYGNIVSISLSGNIIQLDDREARSQYQTSGNDVLRFVGIEGNNIYCYWYDCQWTRGQTAQVMWIKPLVLQD